MLLKPVPLVDRHDPDHFCIFFLSFFCPKMAQLEVVMNIHIFNTDILVFFVFLSRTFYFS